MDKRNQWGCCVQDEPTSGLDARAAAIVMRTGDILDFVTGIAATLAMRPTVYHLYAMPRVLIYVLVNELKCLLIPAQSATR